MKRPAAWTLLVVFSAASAVVAYLYFPQAFSILSLDIAMDRGTALSRARDLAARDRLGPADYRQAASFSLDDGTQTFVELEGGGKDAFTAMLRDGLYSAYTWRVRHFAEGTTNETMFRFRPDGRPYGFVERVAEDEPGAALDAEAARSLAETSATDGWGVVLDPFTLVEAGQEVRPSGRVDHTFTYERASPTLGEGRYRLRLAVSGDRLTEVTHFVRIPEAFTRRYASMRSANDAIGLTSSVGMVLLYGIGGIGVGLFFMMRRRWVIWSPAVRWGLFIAALQTLAIANDWPLAWMGYDTALSYPAFLAQQLVTLASTFVGLSALFALSFVAAETLTRRAFGTHPQFWKLWGREVGSSSTVLGLTAAGFLLVPVFLAYDVLLYVFATRTLGWWSPTESLLHPDVLASYVPWLGAISNSLQAGFWEECMFRAIPIAGAALIGDRFGRRGLFIAIAFVVQAAIFGAGHAPYPAQPAFARPVELILPSIGFGLLYLYFGLLPAIVLHFAFDVVWFALPIFASTAPGVWVQQGMVILVTLVPLWIVFARRFQRGRWTTLDVHASNAAWTPPTRDEEAETERERPAYVVSNRAIMIWLVAAAIAVVAMLTAAIWSKPAAALDVDRGEAVTVARDALDARGVSLTPPWRLMLVPENGGGLAHAFVGETAGEARREELIGRYLPAPRWRARVARLEGDVADRAEEWRLLIDATGEAGFVQHVLPEARPGASLDESEARAVALEAIRNRRGLDADAGELSEVSALPSKLSARTDWLFTFTDTTIEPLPQGEPRLSVRVSGDEVASMGSFVYIPEDWVRDRRSLDTMATIVAVGAAALFGSVLVIAAGLAIRAWSGGDYTPRVFLVAAIVVFFITLASTANNWPALEDGLSTSQPLPLQLFALFGSSLVAAVLLAAVSGLSLGYLPRRVPSARLPMSSATRLGVAAGLVTSVVIAAAEWLQIPAWAEAPDLAALGTLFPMLQFGLAPVGGLILRTVVVTAVLLFVDRITLGWTEHRTRGALVLFVFGFLGTAEPGAGPVAGWMLAGFIGAAWFIAAYALLARTDLTIVPIALGTGAIIQALHTAMAPAFPGALIGSVVSIPVAAAVSWWLFNALRRGD
jgi:hypothetical protein